MIEKPLPIKVKWIIRLLVLSLLITAFIAGYYNVRFELVKEAQTFEYKIK